MKRYDAIVLNDRRQTVHVGRVVWRRSNMVAVVNDRGIVRITHARYRFDYWL